MREKGKSKKKFSENSFSVAAPVLCVRGQCSSEIWEGVMEKGLKPLTVSVNLLPSQKFSDRPHFGYLLQCSLLAIYNLFTK